jgi:hypothetical protein
MLHLHIVAVRRHLETALMLGSSHRRTGNQTQHGRREEYRQDGYSDNELRSMHCRLLFRATNDTTDGICFLPRALTVADKLIFLTFDYSAWPRFLNSRSIVVLPNSHVYCVLNRLPGLHFIPAATSSLGKWT